MCPLKNRTLYTRHCDFADSVFVHGLKLRRNRAATSHTSQVTPAGLELAIPGSVGRCLIHWATGPHAIRQDLNSLIWHFSVSLSRVGRATLLEPTSYSQLNSALAICRRSAQDDAAFSAHRASSKACPHQESNLGCRGHNATSWPLDDVVVGEWQIHELF